MIRFVKAAAAAVKNEWSFGGSHWRDASGGSALSSSGRISHAGKRVTSKTSLEVSAVFDCVRKTAEMISSLPLDLYEKKANGSREKRDDDFAEIIKERPNSNQTAVEFWEGQVVQMVLQGNAYSERLYIGNRFVGLRPLFGVIPRRQADGGFHYEINDRGKRRFLPRDKVFHLRGFGAGDGLGMSAIAYGANSIGAALAADETAGSIFSNSMMPGGVIETDQTLDANQRGQIREMLDAYTGSNRAGKTAVFEAGLKHRPIQMNPDDAQLLETRRFNVEDVCRWFGTPPIVVGHSSEGQTMWGSGVESILLSWQVTGINPLLTKIEKRIKFDLVPASQRRRLYAEYNREAMIQMDSQAKGDLMLKMGMGGTLTANERRARFNLPRHTDPNADALLAQTALAPLADLGREKT